MKFAIMLPLLRKDLTIFFRNKFYTFITIVGLAAYIGLYYAMPEGVDEVFEVGLYAPATSAEAVKILENEGIHFSAYASETDLRQAVLEAKIISGIVFPENMVQAVQSGGKPTVRIYLPSDVDQDTQDVLRVMVETLSLALTGQPLNIDANEVTLGRDLAGEQIPQRNRMLPLFAIIVLMFETMGLASLLAEDVQGNTIRALLVTPLTTGEFFLAKGLFSVGLVMVQALALMTAVGAMRFEPLIMVVTLLAGALLVTGIGFLMGAAGEDMLSVMAWGMLALILLGIPAFGVLFPGTLTGWARIIPTYYLADTVHQVVNFGAGWSQVAGNLLILLAWDAALLAAGALVLKRKFL